ARDLTYLNFSGLLGSPEKSLSVTVRDGVKNVVQPPARRFATPKGVRQFGRKGGTQLPRGADLEKAAAAAVFYRPFLAARRRSKSVRLRNEPRNGHESSQGGRPASHPRRRSPVS